MDSGDPWGYLSYLSSDERSTLSSDFEFDNWRERLRECFGSLPPVSVRMIISKYNTAANEVRKAGEDPDIVAVLNQPNIFKLDPNLSPKV